jgi:hypothetical protein
MSGISALLRQTAGNALAIAVQSITIDKWHLKFNICLNFQTNNAPQVSWEVHMKVKRYVQLYWQWQP